MRRSELIHWFVKRAMTHKVEITDPMVLDFADAAYRFYVKCLGTTSDPDWPCYLVEGSRSKLEPITVGNMYIVTLAREFQHPEDRLTDLAHEMYHRVTKRTRSGRLNTELWVEEMLAARASYKFMVASGYEEFMDFDLASMAALPGRIPVSGLKEVRREPENMRMRAPEYPREYHHSINLLAAQVDEIVGWEAMCKIPSCSTWKQWFETLPEEQCSRVRDLLEL